MNNDAQIRQLAFYSGITIEEAEKVLNDLLEKHSHPPIVIAVYPQTLRRCEQMAGAPRLVAS